MSRATNSPASRHRRKKWLKRAKGFRGGRHRLYRTAREAVQRAMSNEYKHRRTRKRDFRRLWIIRINAACRIYGMSYSKLMYGLKKANCLINRKILANLAINDPKTFSEVATTAKKALVA